MDGTKHSSITKLSSSMLPHQERTSSKIYLKANLVMHSRISLSLWGRQTLKTFASRWSTIWRWDGV